MCKKAKTCRGSITVFASLALLLVASFLLALLEAARVEGLESYAEMNRVNALESVLSEKSLFPYYMTKNALWKAPFSENPAEFSGKHAQKAASLFGEARNMGENLPNCLVYTK